MPAKHFSQPRGSNTEFRLRVALQEAALGVSSWPDLFVGVCLRRKVSPTVGGVGFMIVVWSLIDLFSSAFDLRTPRTLASEVSNVSFLKF